MFTKLIALIALFAGTAHAAYFPTFEEIILHQISTPANPAANYNKIYTKSDNKLYLLNSAGVEVALSGTVTSVAVAVPAEFSVSGSPITSSGTITISKANQNANLIYAGPASGGAAAPTFRNMVAADIPNTAVTPGSYTSADITVDAQGRITAAANGSGGGSTGGVRMTLSGAVVPFVTIDGAHRMTASQSLSTVQISAGNSGASGSTQIRVNQYASSGSLTASATASLSANASLPAGSAASLSGTLSLVSGDIITVDVVSAAANASDLSVEF